jgi:hypothetical protein
VTINLFVQEDRSPSGTGRAQFQTHANNQRASDWNVQAPTYATVDLTIWPRPSSLADLARVRLLVGFDLR